MPAKKPVGAKKVRSGSKSSDHISDAVADVDKELLKLSKKKDSLLKQKEANTLALARTKVKETKLKSELSNLLAKQEMISTKSSGIRSKLLRVKDKISRITRIKGALTKPD